MKLNYFKAAEQDIMTLPTLKKSLEFLKAKQKRLIENGKPTEPKTVNYSKPYTNSHFVNDTLNEILSLSEVTNQIKETEQEIEHIEKILNCLELEQKNVLTMFYIERLPVEKIAAEIYVESEKTVYNIRNKALMQYALLSYGAVAKQPHERM